MNVLETEAWTSPPKVNVYSIKQGRVWLMTSAGNLYTKQLDFFSAPCTSWMQLDTQHSECKGGEVYFGSRFVEVSVHNGLAPRQRRNSSGYGSWKHSVVRVAGGR